MIHAESLSRDNCPAFANEWEASMPQAITASREKIVARRFGSIILVRSLLPGCLLLVGSSLRGAEITPIYKLPGNYCVSVPATAHVPFVQGADDLIGDGIAELVGQFHVVQITAVNGSSIP
jgi:hypothetical protein